MRKQKKSNKVVKQCEVWICDLSKGSVDHETSYVHPVLVVSADSRNEASPNVVVFPITSATKRYQPCHYKLYKKDYDFFNCNTNTVLCEDVRSVSKNRLYTKKGEITEKDLRRILTAKEYIFLNKR